MSPERPSQGRKCIKVANKGSKGGYKCIKVADKGSKGGLLGAEFLRKGLRGIKISSKGDALILAKEELFGGIKK